MLKKLEDVCLITDGSHSSPKGVEQGNLMVSVRDFTSYGFDFGSCKRISDEDYKSLLKLGCAPEFGDVLVGKDGARCFEDIIIYRQPEKPVLLSSIAILRCDTQEITPEYLYYFLKSPSVHRDVRENYVSGSAIPRIVLKDFKRLPIEVPSIDQQIKITSLLELVDQKIQNNIRINKNLEKQAEVLFEHMFLSSEERFSWESGTFSDLIESTLGGDWGKESPVGNYTEMVYCIRGADIPEVKAGNKGKMPTRYILPKNYATKHLLPGDIVVEISGGSPTQSTGRVAAVSQSLLDRYDKGMVCTNFCRAIKPKPGYSMFVYYYWQYLYNRKVFFLYENGTTGIKNLDLSGFISSEEIVIPPEALIKEFDDYCQTVFDHIFSNGLENEHLAIVRDTLLPKLMSGELDVSSLDI